MYQRALLFVCLFGIAFGATCDTANVICQLSSGSNCANSDSNTFNVGGNSYSFSLFNAISFGRFNLPQGDVQGRLAVQGDFTAGTTKGATIADQISSSNGDTDFTYSLIVGGNANWVSGELYPLGDSTLKKGNAFVGGSFTGADSLGARVTANCNGNSGCLDSYFNNAKTFWENWSIDLSNKNSTVSYSISESKVLTITCDSSDNRLNIVNIPDSEFNTVVGYSSSGCKSNSVFVFNIFGGNDVIFGGEGFVNQIGTVYNIVGSGRMVNATVFVRGSIINPSGSLDQVGGTIFGNVVVGEINNLIQINRPTCPSDVGTSSESSTTASGSASETSGASTTDGNTGSDDARGNSAAQSIVCVFALVCLCFFAL